MESMDTATDKYTFGLWDYVVFALMLLASAAIGVYYAVAGRGQQSSQDFLVGRRSMSAMPISISLTASFVSAITILGTPAEVYRYGAIFSLHTITFVLVVAVTSELFLPVFYRLGVTSTYEYLEMRFGRVTRLCGTVLFVLQTVLYSGLVIYAPALALNQVTELDLWGAVLSTGIVCTLYCTLGGLKAVVWTDVLQMTVMVAGFLAVIAQAVSRQGGLLSIINHSAQGGRLNLWNFDPSPLKRYTFWTIVIGSSFVWTGVYGVNQNQVQRYVSCKSLTHARTALCLNMLGLWIVILCSTFCGLCLYSVYRHCDPWTIGLVSAPDQLMPYLVVDILKDFPGVPGLFVAAVYSGTLSTISSSINSLTTVTVEDLIKPNTSLSDKTLFWISKGLSLVYGILCIGMASIASIMGGLLEAALSFLGIIGGPLLGLFCLGIFCPFANATGGVVGIISGLAISMWVGIGAQAYPSAAYHSQSLNLTTAGCNLTTNEAGLNWTVSSKPPVSFDDKEYRLSPVEQWYSLSYLYFSAIGTLTTVAVGIIVSLLTGAVKGSVKVSPTLMLIKEDLMCYHIYLILKRKTQGISQALKRSSKLDHKINKEIDSGTKNPAFYSSDLDLSQLQLETKHITFSP